MALSPIVMGTSSAQGQLARIEGHANDSSQSPPYVFVPQTVDEGVQHGCDHSVHHRGCGT